MIKVCFPANIDNSGYGNDKNCEIKESKGIFFTNSLRIKLNVKLVFNNRFLKYRLFFNKKGSMGPVIFMCIVIN